MTRPAGRVRKFLKFHGSGRVSLRQEVSKLSRVGSGRVGSGRVGSGRVGSPFPDLTREIRLDP